jgi:hypothetical protein
LRDRDTAPSFGYLVDFALIPGSPDDPRAISKVTFGEASGTARGGARTRVPVPANSFLVLRGFDFEFRGDPPDNHLRDFGILRNGDYLEVFFGDSDPTTQDDEFDWRVQWAIIGPPVLSVILGEAAEPAEAALGDTAP